MIMKRADADALHANIVRAVQQPVDGVVSHAAATTDASRFVSLWSTSRMLSWSDSCSRLRRTDATPGGCKSLASSGSDVLELEPELLLDDDRSTLVFKSNTLDDDLAADN